MTTTIQSIVTDARELIDVAAQSHYDDAQLGVYAIEGVRTLYSERPSSRYGSSLGIDDQAFPERAPATATPEQKAAADAALLSFEVRINETRWRRGVVYWTAALAHEVGITDSVNLQLSQTLKKQAVEIFRS